MIFLLEYDRPRGALVSLREFGDDEMSLAHDACLEREIQLLGSDWTREVVMLQSRSLESLKFTHMRYFATLEEMFAGLCVNLQGALENRLTAPASPAASA